MWFRHRHDARAGDIEKGSSVTVAGSPANAIRSTGTPVRG
jgi:hypothetical protein